MILNLWSEACFLHNPSVTALSLSPSSIQTALCIGGCLESRGDHHHHSLSTLSLSSNTRDGQGSYFFHEPGRGGEGPGQKSMGQGGAGRGTTPSPQCGRGQNPRSGEHTACISWLKSYAAEKEILICIALSEVNLLNINSLDRNHN